MTDHKEEQELEIEALTSIFAEGTEFKRISDTEFTIKLLPDPTGETVNHVQCTLHITYGDTYPDEPPTWELEEMESLSDPKQEELKSKVEEAVSESLGMVMVYAMAEACQDYLKDNNVKALSMHEEMMKRVKEEGGEGEEDEEGEDEDDDDEEEAEEEEWKGLADKTLCPESERITPDAFAEWKLKFDEEMIAAGILKREGENKAQTGKAFFLAEQEKSTAAAGKDAGGAAGGGPVVYNSALFGEEDDDDLDDLSGGED